MKPLLPIPFLLAILALSGLEGRAEDVVITPPAAWTITRAGDWDQWLDRTNDWLGADGVYSISLSERDDAGSGRFTSNLVVFGDTFFGGVDASNRLQPGWRMPRNTAALIPAGAPARAQIPFFWGTDAWGSAVSLFTPATPSSTNGEWYWLNDGLTVSGVTHIFALRMGPAGEGYWGFETHGISLLSSPTNEPLRFAGYHQLDAPLRFDASNDARGEILFGAAVMANTTEAGAPHPDGYVYIYGHQNDPFNKKLVAARVPPGQLRDFSMWRYWNGGSWTAAIAAATALAERISSEFSVSPLPDGRYLLAVERDTLGPDVCVSVGETPAGPFGPYTTLWTAPEVSDPALGTNVMAYNAKAHPQLARPGELLITYNLSSLSGGEVASNIDIYRPRFLRARMECVVQALSVSPDARAEISWRVDSNAEYAIECCPLSSGSWTETQRMTPTNGGLAVFTNDPSDDGGALFRLKWSSHRVD